MTQTNLSAFEVLVEELFSLYNAKDEVDKNPKMVGILQPILRKNIEDRATVLMDTALFKDIHATLGDHAKSVLEDLCDILDLIYRDGNGIPVAVYQENTVEPEFKLTPPVNSECIDNKKPTRTFRKMREGDWKKRIVEYLDSCTGSKIGHNTICAILAQRYVDVTPEGAGIDPRTLYGSIGSALDRLAKDGKLRRFHREKKQGDVSYRYWTAPVREKEGANGELKL